MHTIGLQIPLKDKVVVVAYQKPTCTPFVYKCMFYVLKKFISIF